MQAGHKGITQDIIAASSHPSPSHLFTHPTTHRLTHPSLICPSIHQLICPSIQPPIDPFIYPFTHPSVHPSALSFTYLSIGFLSSSFRASVFSFISHPHLTSTFLVQTLSLSLTADMVRATLHTYLNLHLLDAVEALGLTWWERAEEEGGPLPTLSPSHSSPAKPRLAARAGRVPWRQSINQSTVHSFQSRSLGTHCVSALCHLLGTGH